MRPEHLLSAAILRVDTKALATRVSQGKGPLNVKTVDVVASDTDLVRRRD